MIFFWFSRFFTAYMSLLNSVFTEISTSLLAAIFAVNLWFALRILRIWGRLGKGLYFPLKIPSNCFAWSYVQILRLLHHHRSQMNQIQCHHQRMNLHFSQKRRYWGNELEKPVHLTSLMHDHPPIVSFTIFTTGHLRIISLVTSESACMVRLCWPILINDLWQMEQVFLNFEFDFFVHIQEFWSTKAFDYVCYVFEI